MERAIVGVWIQREAAVSDRGLYSENKRLLFYRIAAHRMAGKLGVKSLVSSLRII